MKQTERQMRQAELIRLGTEYGNLSDRKLAQWLNMLEHVEPSRLAQAVDKILSDPEREHLPRIGHILGLCPRRPGVGVKRAFWDWQSATVTGDLSELSNEKREREAAFALRLFAGRGSNWFQKYVRPMILAFDPQAFEKELERAQKKLPAVTGADPLADERVPA